MCKYLKCQVCGEEVRVETIKRIPTCNKRACIESWYWLERLRMTQWHYVSCLPRSGVEFEVR